MKENATGALELTNDNAYLSAFTPLDRYRIRTGGNLDDNAGGSIGVTLVLMDRGKYYGAATAPFDPQLRVLPDGLDSSDLSDAPPNVALFDAAWLDVFSTNNGKVAASGRLDAITLPTSSVPEPSTLLLALLALTGARGITSRRNKQNE